MYVRRSTLRRREADRDDERELTVGDLGWRWWKRSGALDQVERRGIRGRPGDDPAAHQVALPINAECKTDHALNAERLRRWMRASALLAIVANSQPTKMRMPRVKVPRQLAGLPPIAA